MSASPDRPPAADGETLGQGTVLAELRSRLEAAYAQLHRYAADFNISVQKSQEKEKDLARANYQLHLYAHDLRVALDAEKAKTAEVESAYYDTVLRLMLASQYRDLETGEHIQRMVDYVRLLAVHWGLPEAEAEIMASAAALHDLGKIAVDDSILRKAGDLTPEEREVMELHTVRGAEMLAGSPSPILQQAHEIALTHHERWDGSGYPRGLAGKRIPLAGRLVMLADQYDALRSSRPYKPAFDHAKTARVLLEGDGRTRPEHFDPRLLELFRDVHQGLDEVWRRWQEAHPQ